MALDRKTRAVGRFMHILQTTALSIDHAAYQYATHQAHRAFFSTYDADWGAHELNWTPEYMPALPLRRVKGILYLQAYLEALQTENQILGAVPLTYVQALLKQASVPAETGASPLEALSETLDPGGAVVECNLCALLLDDLMVARGMNAEAILDALRLRGRAAEYVRHYCERGLPRQSQ